VREVHRKLVVLGEQGESPPGFTAVVLIDESHVTAHCYSERGWLAIDVFTCGGHDPRPLAAAIRRRVEEFAPATQCAQHTAMRRFLHGSTTFAEAEQASDSPIRRPHGRRMATAMAARNAHSTTPR
jgi:S-adenosylmethionine/arginine decarboxylase-like enzyme